MYPHTKFHVPVTNTSSDVAKDRNLNAAILILYILYKVALTKLYIFRRLLLAPSLWTPVEWLCHSYLRSSHNLHVGIIDNRKWNSTGGLWPLMACCSCQVS
jgi:hypothetical protein